MRGFFECAGTEISSKVYCKCQTAPKGKVIVNSIIVLRCLPLQNNLKLLLLGLRSVTCSPEKPVGALACVLDTDDIWMRTRQYCYAKGALQVMHATGLEPSRHNKNQRSMHFR